MDRPIRQCASTTYVQAGERTACIGCHEPSASVLPPRGSMPLALNRPASHINPGELGGRPFSFAEMIQPVLDRHCVACHGGDRTDGGVDLTSAPENGFTKSYWSLCRDAAPGSTELLLRPLLSFPATPNATRFKERDRVEPLALVAAG